MCVVHGTIESAHPVRTAYILSYDDEGREVRTELTARSGLLGSVYAPVGERNLTVTVIDAEGNTAVQKINFTSIGGLFPPPDMK